ncbi:MAG: acylphosphatase [Chloroflexi bacterium]|nr:acylphosphatase [Chloroflexota bacterium]
MSEQASFIAVVHGRVQGVYFRAFVRDHAIALGLTGYVENRYGGSVEVRAEGEKGKLEELLDYLRTGPSRARVDRVDVEWSDFKGRFQDFSVNY